MSKKTKIKVESYDPNKTGNEDEALFHSSLLEKLDDAKNYFTAIIKPRLDLSYKLYIAYTGDRAKEIQPWQSNLFVPYIMSMVETMMPRVVDARPEFSVVGREDDDSIRAEKQRMVCDYLWEKAKMDRTNEDFVRAGMIYGQSYLQTSYRVDKKKLKFLRTTDMGGNKKLEWKEEERVFYDDPYAEWADNYSVWYDWHNINREDKQYWFRRRVLTKDQIKMRFPLCDEKRLEQGILSGPGELTDYAAVRTECRELAGSAVRGGLFPGSGASDRFTSALQNEDNTMYETFEVFLPFTDQYTVLVGGGRVPVIGKNGWIPNPFDHKESPFVEAQYLRIPGEYEGVGIPLLLAGMQATLNAIKNQRVDSATLSIHKMWIVSPLANIDQSNLVTRPFGIIYSSDPNGVREVQFSDIKESAYREEQELKSDMRNGVGIDDFSMGGGGTSNSATEVRHLRESTLERVRLYVNHIGDAYSVMMRHWIDMCRQVMTKERTIRVIGKSGENLYPLITKEDFLGSFDYKATVLPSLAGQEEVEKKQAMDLFQLISQIPPEASGIDIKKVLTKMISLWGWSPDDIAVNEEELQAEQQKQQEAMQQQGLGPDGKPMDPQMQALLAQQQAGAVQEQAPEGNMYNSQFLDGDSMSKALGLIGGLEEEPQASPFGEASMPIDLMNGAQPPTVSGIPNGTGGPGKTTNKSGSNRPSKVNTAIPNTVKHYSEQSQILNKAHSI